MDIFKGFAHKFGDDINTDYIISSRRKRDTLDLDVLKRYILEDIDSGFAKRFKPRDILVAGHNFGCGSAMEIASLVIKAAGIDVVAAKSFSRTFYRNGINSGLLLIECDTGDFLTGDQLKIEIGDNRITIHNLTQKIIRETNPPGGILLRIFKSGGLVNYIRENRRFSV